MPRKNARARPQTKTTLRAYHQRMPSVAVARVLRFSLAHIVAIPIIHGGVSGQPNLRNAKAHTKNAFRVYQQWMFSQRLSL